MKNNKVVIKLNCVEDLLFGILCSIYYSISMEYIYIYN